MELYVGMDVSLKETSICVVDDNGEIVSEGTVISEPEAIAEFIRAKAAGATRIGLETGPTTTWLWHELRALGLPVICIDARHAKAALSMQINKSDRNDAAGIARIYALDSTTIALCLSVFPWAHFRTTKAAVKMHTLLDLRGNIPSFIHISDGKLHDVHALDMLLPEAGAIYVVDRGYVDFARLYVLHQAGAFFVTRAKSNIDAHRVYSAPTDRSTGIICDQTISLDGFYPVRITPNFCGASASRTPSPARRWSSSPTTSRFRPPPSARSTKAAGRWNSSSSGSSSIFGSSSSTARRRTR